mmetsp:Transcript_31666/g.48440  ORF Transcript_31666/g.48440 Transcript_31666/m.48440 type:complete len:161 (-) Transcript_31666:1226-1708(-)
MEAPAKREKGKLAEKLEEEVDNESMENNTNLNWQTGEFNTEKKRKKGIMEGTISEYSIIKTEKQNINLQCMQSLKNYELNTADFYEASHYYIDTLKEEFCYPKEDGWYELKEIMTMKSYQNKLLEDSDETVKVGTTSHESSLSNDKNPKFRTGKWTEQEH